MSRKLKVFVGMSGGVDSSVAALLLKRRGYEVVGVYIRSYNLDGCSDRDARDARRTAEHIGVPFYVWDFEKEYKESVVDYFVNSYASGDTPNPDVICNRDIKFGVFYKKACMLGADFIATGHYVRKKGDKLITAKDKNKDQTYFLWTLGPDEIRHALFPIGDYEKSEVRKIAQKANLPIANKKDSQGICFLGKVSMKEFLKTKLPTRRGLITTIDGQKIGTHEGAHFYTIGQRHGLNLKDKNTALGHKGSEDTSPHYVIKKDTKKNKLTVAKKGDLGFEVSSLEIKNLNLKSSQKNSEILVRLRYRQPLSLAKLKIDSNHTANVELQTPQQFVATGQSAVFYSKTGELLGGGVIHKLTS